MDKQPRRNLNEQRFTFPSVKIARAISGLLEAVGYECATTPFGYRVTTDAPNSVVQKARELVELAEVI